MPAAALPHIDEHAVEIGAAPEQVWSALRKVLRRGFSGRLAGRYARAVGCESCEASEGELATGSTLVGFRVAEAAPGSRLVLEGRHRFSRYRLAFHIDRLADSRVRLRARTDAAFPGAAARAYRALVIDSRGHALLLRRLLRRIKAKAEASSASC